MIAWTSRSHERDPETAARPRILILVLVVVGINAVIGGVGLMINGLGMNPSQLDGSPFDSFPIPGLLLAIVVGGATLGAAWAEWARNRHAPMVSLAAGFIVVGWILGQLAMLGYVSPLQPVILGCGLMIAWLAWHRTRSDRRP